MELAKSIMAQKKFLFFIFYFLFFSFFFISFCRKPSQDVKKRQKADVATEFDKDRASI